MILSSTHQGSVPCHGFFYMSQRTSLEWKKQTHLIFVSATNHKTGASFVIQVSVFLDGFTFLGCLSVIKILFHHLLTMSSCNHFDYQPEIDISAFMWSR